LTEHEQVFDREVLTFDVAKVAKPTAQRLDEVGDGGRGKIAQTRQPRAALSPKLTASIKLKHSR
jgi:hypothetical protein